MTNWTNDMDEFRNVIHTKLTNPPCELKCGLIMGQLIVNMGCIP